MCGKGGWMEPYEWLWHHIIDWPHMILYWTCRSTLVMKWGHVVKWSEQTGPKHFGKSAFTLLTDKKNLRPQIQSWMDITAAYESKWFKLPPVHWITWIKSLQNPIFSKWIECCLILTLLANSAVMAEGHISSQTRLVIHLALHFQEGKLLPFYKCEDCGWSGWVIWPRCWLVRAGTGN